MGKPVINRVIATLEIPSEITEQIQDSKNKLEATQASTWINPTPPDATIVIDPPYTDIAKNIATAEAAQTAVSTHAPGATAARDTSFEVMFSDQRSLLRVVQFVADRNPLHAEEIVLGAGFHVQHQGSVNKQNFIAKNGPVSGSAKLIAKRVSRYSCHDWWLSRDGGKTWEQLTPTMEADTLITGLTKGSIILFRHRNILPLSKGGPQEYDQPFELVIQ